MAQIFYPTLGSAEQKKIIVVSHERSGTHFLMNTLALNFGYVSKPWINIDFELGLNLYSANILAAHIRQMHDRPILNIVKSHHQAGFFADLVGYLGEQFHIFYMYRDPRDVMVSFWRLLFSMSWDEGPKSHTVGEFMRAAPRGGILRYQKEQAATVLHRWQDHVQGWANLAGISGSPIVMLSFERLNLDFDETVKSIGTHINRPVTALARPNKEVNVIHAGPGQIGRYREHFTPDDYDFVRDSVGDTMSRLGIAWDADEAKF